MQLILHMMSATSQLNLQVTVTMNPFTVVIDSVTYGSKLTNPPVPSRPFDLLITCGLDNFQVATSYLIFNEAAEGL